MHSRSVSPSTPALQSRSSIPIPTRDSRFYYSDGNTVLLVENTLFKVHRSALTKEKSTFESMFSLDSDLRSSTSNNSGVTVGPEGESDDNPIRLQGDTADEFRSLLWALYALPHEFEDAMTNAVNSKLFNLARVAHKYEFRAIENWVLDKLKAIYLRPTHSNIEGSILVQLTELASLCEQRDLFEAATTRWTHLITSRKDVALAIGMAERLNLRSLLGMAYHVMLLQGREVWDADPQLTRAHRIRLLSGYYALSSLCERLPNEPPRLQHHPGCTGVAQVQCHQAWARLWRSTLHAGKHGCKEHKIFAGNLAYTTTEERLMAFFAPVQREIISAQIILRGSRSAGYGFVVVSSTEAAGKAVQSLNGEELDGRKVIVEIAQPTEPKDEEKEKTDGPFFQYADVIGKMGFAASTLKAERELPDNGMLGAMPRCKERALMATSAKLKEIQESLADYFTDVA